MDLAVAISMAKPLGLLSGIAKVVDSVDVFRDYLGVFSPDSYASSRFGITGSVLMTFLFMHPKKIGEFEWDLNSWSDDDVLEWKKSHLANCNMTAVAVCTANANLPSVLMSLCRVPL